MRHRVPSLPIPLRPLLAPQPNLVAPVLQVVAPPAQSHPASADGPVGSRSCGRRGHADPALRLGANLNIHLHCQCWTASGLRWGAAGAGSPMDPPHVGPQVPRCLGSSPSATPLKPKRLISLGFVPPRADTQPVVKQGVTQTLGTTNMQVDLPAALQIQPALVATAA